MAALDIRRGFPAMKVILYTYGQPRVGNPEFSNYVFSQLPQSYIRVINYDDGVAHSPHRVQGYKHAGNEVWYKHKDYDGRYIECENYPYENENENCSHSLWLKTGVTSHIYYFGVRFSGMCAVN